MVELLSMSSTTSSTVSSTVGLLWIPESLDTVDASDVTEAEEDTSWMSEEEVGRRRRGEEEGRGRRR
jgi:hypothetical protein